MDQSLILFDIDGTLLQSDINEIPQSTIDAIYKLKEAGHQLAVATGRSLRDIDERIRNLPFDTFVTANGQYIVHHGEVIYENSIPTKTIERLIDEAKHMETELGLITPTRVTVTNLTPWVEKSFNQVSMEIPEIIPNIYQEEPILQVWFFSDQFTDLSEKFKDELRFVPWISFGADVVPFGGSKAEGIKQMVEHLPEKPKNIIVFGDGHNDIEMLQFADIGIVMGNAIDEVKKHGDFVTKSIDDDGIYFACEHFNLF